MQRQNASLDFLSCSTTIEVKKALKTIAAARYT